MPGLNEDKMEIVRALVESAPDKVVGGLQAALAESAGDAVLAGVRALVEVEAQDRRLRNAILLPIAPLCVGDGAANDRLVFPARALALIWRGLKATAPDEVAQAAAALADPNPETPAPEVFDALAAAAAAGLREAQVREFAMAAELCDQARPDGAASLCACLDLGPIVRNTTGKLGEWISRTSDENTASARVAYKDAVAVAEDSGPRFFEMLAGQLAHPWMVLRILSAIMDGPDERYFSGSELASFPVRLMDEIDRRLIEIARFDVNGGPKAGIAAAKLVETVTLQISELEETIELDREGGGWGGRIGKQKRSLANVVEGKLREGEKTALAALPTQPARIAKILRAIPKVAEPPNRALVHRAVTLLTFADESRSSANYGGFSAARTKTLEKVGDMLDPYVEELLERIRSHEVADVETACAYLAVAADFARLARDEKAADIIRRRTVSACAAEKASHPEDGEAAA
jgi:hypothetical protein